MSLAHQVLHACMSKKSEKMLNVDVSAFFALARFHEKTCRFATCANSCVQRQKRGHERNDDVSRGGYDL